ncbi:cbb3-type cytochrome oxidase subunit 3 [Bacillus ectoiniformans]|uniref:hypothetical protein n=1 Tax=Bacillus ectoiniformans TaxID=1494429 RepID=UPI00195DB132|nr:hypothetical protein [Bacillus ectoiniformans]MBM7649230.1 cbb3-type cytochrome oxidase subunit 3 [Bacillus ectoiniformans]
MRIFNWKVWAIFALLTAILSVVYIAFAEENKGNNDRKTYMTLKEYNRIDIGMDYDKYLEIQKAIPQGEKELINAHGQYKIYSLTYKGKHEASFATIFIKEYTDGKKVIHDKSQFKLADG